MAYKSLMESIYGDKHPSEYKRMFESQFKDIPGTSYLRKGTKVHNPKESDHTSDRKAYLDYPWIKYWQAFTENHNNKLQCACCDKAIYVDENTSECQKDAVEQNKSKSAANPVTPADLKAVGAHLYANGKDASGGYVIVPMCKEHNGKASDVEMEISEYTAAVEELHATMKK